MNAPTLVAILLLTCLLALLVLISYLSRHFSRLSFRISVGLSIAFLAIPFFLAFAAVAFALISLIAKKLLPYAPVLFAMLLASCLLLLSGFILSCRLIVHLHRASRALKLI